MAIVRVSRAKVRSGREQAFLAELRDLVGGFAAQHPGLLGWDIWTAEGGRTCVFVSRWADEAALVGYAGAGWATDPVTFPGEDDFLEEPLDLTHYVLDGSWP